MGGIGLPELLIVLVIIMIIFGAGKIPQIGSAFGKTIKNFKQSMKEPDKEPDGVSVDTIANQAEVSDVEEPKAVTERSAQDADAAPSQDPLREAPDKK